MGMEMKEGDYIEHLHICSTHDFLLFFTNRGKVYRLKVYELPEGSRTAKGRALVNVLPLRDGERVMAVIPTRDFSEGKFLAFATAKGQVKKTEFPAYNTPIRADGIIAIKVRDGDELVQVRLTSGDDDLLLVSKSGHASRFSESAVRSMGRDTSGVKGMNVAGKIGKEPNRVLAMDVARDDAELFVVTENGYGKRTAIPEYPVKGRGTKGVLTIKLTEKKGGLAGALIVREHQDLLFISQNGMVQRTKAGGISQMGRATQGVRVMNIKDDDRVSAVALVVESSARRRRGGRGGRRGGRRRREAGFPGELSIGDGPVLTRRALNRALLERQGLLRRVELTPEAALEHLVGLQAQEPMPPYFALWSRLRDFDPAALGDLLNERRAVRMTLMRGTIHMTTVADALALRPLVQVVIERTLKGAFGRRMGGAEPGRIAAATRELLAEEVLGARELGRRLVARGIGTDPEAMGNAARIYVPMVQVPPRGVWGSSGRALYATLESWTGRELLAEPSIDKLALRYLRAFGPASVKDMQNWSGLTRMAEVFERLRPRLAEFRDESGVELFDLPDAPRPDPDPVAPARFLGEYDNVLLGHADRGRIIPAGFPWKEMLAHGRFVNNLLIDGILRATWWLERDRRRRVTLGIRPFGRLSAAERSEVGEEAARLLEVAGPEAGRARRALRAARAG